MEDIVCKIARVLRAEFIRAAHISVAIGFFIDENVLLTVPAGHKLSDQLFLLRDQQRYKVQVVF